MGLESTQQFATETGTSLPPWEFALRKISRPELYKNLAMLPAHTLRWQRVDKHLRGLVLSLGRPVEVLQIGANDGKQTDPVHRYIKQFDWRGVLVEPVRQNFTALASTYAAQVASNSIKLVRAAISSEVGTATMFVPRTGDSALKGKESLHPEVIQKHEWMVQGEWRDHVAEEVVPTLTVAALKSMFPGFHPDVLVTDTEGHDAIILDQIDFAAVDRPSVVFFEHAHLGAEDHNRTRERLLDSGYALTVLRRDTIAIA